MLGIRAASNLARKNPRELSSARVLNKFSPHLRHGNFAPRRDDQGISWYSAHSLSTKFARYFAALRFAAFGSTASLKPAPGTNFGTLPAGILIFVPLLGLNPARAARL